jgi:hypothetical protein
MHGTSGTWGVPARRRRGARGTVTPTRVALSKLTVVPRPLHSRRSSSTTRAHAVLASGEPSPSERSPLVRQAAIWVMTKHPIPSQRQSRSSMRGRPNFPDGGGGCGGSSSGSSGNDSAGEVPMGPGGGPNFNATRDGPFNVTRRLAWTAVHRVRTGGRLYEKTTGLKEERARWPERATSGAVDSTNAASRPSMCSRSASTSA